MPSLVDPARLPVPDEYTSSGCFETMRAYRGRIFRLDAHLARLEASAVFLGVRLPWTTRVLAAKLERAVARSGLREAMVRVAFLPSSAGGPARSHLVVQPVPQPPASAYRDGLSVACVPSRKFAVGSITPQAKYSSRLGSILAVMEAQLRGADEAIFLDPDGGVTESTASNLGIVREGRVLTPPCWLGLLPGITRDVLEELARALRLPLRETPLTRHEVYNAREVFLLSTIKEVLSVTVVDGRRIGTGRPGPITTRLRRAFRALVRRECRGPVETRSHRAQAP